MSLYWIEVLSNLKTLFILLSIVFTCFSFPAFVFSIEYEEYKYPLKYSLIGLTIFILLSIFIPSKEVLLNQPDNQQKEHYKCLTV